MSEQFTHLHVHSEYSLLDGLCKFDSLIAQAKKHGQTAIALTDHGAMYGALHFYNACKKAGIKPLIGMEAYVAKKKHTDKQSQMGSDQSHLTLLAMNHTGYVNLMHLTSVAHLEGFSYKPRIDFELLSKYSNDLICTSGCMSSEFNKLLRDNKDAQAKKLFSKYKQLFGDRFYIEIQHHPTVLEQTKLRKKQISIARELDIPLVATNDVHYVHRDDAEAQDALVCVQTRKLISDTKRLKMIDNPDLYLKSSQEMRELFSDVPEAITNTQVITDRCNLEIPTGVLHFPNFTVPKGKTVSEYFTELAMNGLEKKFKKITPKIMERLKYELEVITQKGYANYFLITEDFVRWAKKQGIAVGPGRGSAAGSLVSYALDITTINPFQHGLTFERFLNPQRPTPPDIDLDFADDRRDEVLDYVMNKYGSDHVAHVITFGRMEARVAVRDIGRVLGMPYEDPDKIAKLIPNFPGKKVSLSDAINTVPELAEYYKQPRFKRLLDLAKKVESSVRHHSVHAAAVIIADKPLPNYTPIQRDTKTGKTVTQYDMYALDLNVKDTAIGLLKFDFLGLRNLSVIQRALQLIKAHKSVELDLDTLPLDDIKTFNLLSSGETLGVFQLESAGMRRVARSLKPSQFSDITAMVALYRPGPMDLIPQFIESKHNSDKIVYLHPSLKPILSETYGVMVYQEQILSIAHVMGGYSIAEADILRKAIGKKDKQLLDKNKKTFVSQSVEHGYKKAVAEKVWSFIEAFANYGFNKAHATSYAMISYQTAYLKANYPVEYLASLLTTEANSHSINRDLRVSQSIETCKKMGIQLLPPSINTSGKEFVIEPDPTSLEGLAIRFGLTGIKNIGAAAIENILETRDEIGKFTSFTQFLIKTDSRKVNKKVLESLIKVGAFDQFSTRSTLLENLDDIRQKATQFQSDIDGQDSLFSSVSTSSSTIQDTFLEIKEYPQQELLSFEKELLGLYLTDHPMGQAMAIVAERATKEIGELDHSIHQGQSFIFGGVLTKLREVTTKKGKQMAFATLEDQTGSIDVVIFPKTFEQSSHILKIDSVVLIKAKVEYRDEELQLLADKITMPTESELAQIPEQQQHQVFIPRKTSRETLEKLRELLQKDPGDDHVIIIIPNGSQPKKIVLPYGVKWSDKLDHSIQALLET